MEVKQEEKPDLKPLPQRNGPPKNQQENGGAEQHQGGDRKSFIGGQNRGNFQNKQGPGGPRGRGGFGGPRQNDQRGGGPPNNRQGGGGGLGRNNEEYGILGRLKQLGGPTHDIPPVDQTEVKFSGRNRLYVGNLTNDISEEELKEMFKPYGEIAEAFVNKEKNFAFLKMDFHLNAEKAKRELDGSTRKNRQIRIRFAPNATSVKVKNLTPYVSNELLYKAFEVFGPVERAVIIVDDRGKPTGEGIVEFARKNSATSALKYCNDRCFFITASLRPAVVEILDQYDDADGLPDKSFPRKNQEFFKERNYGPRFAEPGSFEHEYGTRWKQLHELYKQKHEALKREMQIEEEKLEAQMEYARYEHETELLREQLRQREMDRDHKKTEWEKKQIMVEEQRTREEQSLARQQEAMQIKMQRQEEELRRRQQENTLFMQAQQLNSLLDQQEINQGSGYSNQGNRKFEGNDSRRTFDMMNQNSQEGYIDYNHGQGQRQNSRFDEHQQGQRGGQNRNWMNNNRAGGNGEDFQNKRRRF